MTNYIIALCLIIAGCSDTSKPYSETFASGISAEGNSTANMYDSAAYSHITVDGIHYRCKGQIYYSGGRQAVCNGKLIDGTEE